MYKASSGGAQPTRVGYARGIPASRPGGLANVGSKSVELYGTPEYGMTRDMLAGDVKFSQQAAQKYGAKSTLQNLPPPATVGVRPPAAQSQTGASSVFDHAGIKAFNQGDYNTAIKEFERALSRQPNNKELQYNLGAAYYKSKNYEKAAEHFSQSTLSNNPSLKSKAEFALANTFAVRADGLKDPVAKIGELKRASDLYDASIKTGGQFSKAAQDNKRVINKQLMGVEGSVKAPNISGSIIKSPFSTGSTTSISSQLKELPGQESNAQRSKINLTTPNQANVNVTGKTPQQIYGIPTTQTSFNPFRSTGQRYTPTTQTTSTTRPTYTQNYVPTSRRSPSSQQSTTTSVQQPPRYSKSNVQSAIAFFQKYGRWPNESELQ